MKIVRLEAENVKRLRAVEIEPDGSLVVIAGRNGQGKSSVLDAIWMALAGKRAQPARPVREGEERATIRLELDDMVVTRTIKADGSTTLKLEDRDGKKYASPQALLDKLVAGLSFDPLEFARMAPKARLELLRGLVGLDFTKLDSERSDVFARRTEANREAKRLDGELSGVPPRADVPAEEVSVGELAAKLQAAEDKRRRLDACEAEVRRCDDRVEAIRAKIAELEAELEVHEQEREGALFEAEMLRGDLPDVAGLRAQLATVDATNAAVRANRRRAELETKLDATRAHSSALTSRLDEIDAEKRAALEGAAYPLPGLRLGEEGVTLNGLPFEQASSAEQLRASVAIGLALNPKIRVLLVRDGSLLDSDSLRLVAEMAAEADAQVWLERVTDGAGGVGVVIEDGAVVGAEGAEAAE